MQRRSCDKIAGFTVVESLVIAALVVVILLLLLPGLKRSRERASTPGSSIAAELQNVEKAKALYVAERRLSDGAAVTLTDLIKAGYYRPIQTGELHGIIFVPGNVGESADYQVSTHAVHKEDAP